MKLVIQKRLHKMLLLCGYVIFPVISWCFLGAYGAVFGFIVAYLFDRFYPRTMTFLSWDEVELGISNFLDSSVLGARFSVSFGKRKIYFIRGEMRRQAMLALRFSRKQWEGIIDKQTEAFFLKKRVSVIMPEELWRFRWYVTMDLEPGSESVKKAVAIIRDICERSGVGFEDLHCRGDYCHLTTRELFQNRSQRGHPESAD